MALYGGAPSVTVVPQRRTARLAGGATKKLMTVMVFCNPIVDSNSALLRQVHVAERGVADFVNVKLNGQDTSWQRHCSSFS
jgi:hypothetical protein